MHRLADLTYRLPILMLLCALALGDTALAADPPVDARAVTKSSATPVASVRAAQPMAVIAGLPNWTPPPAYRVDMTMKSGAETFTMKRFISGEQVRSEIKAEGHDIVLIELGDEAGTSYTLMPEEKRGIKSSRAKMLEVTQELETSQAEVVKDEGEAPAAKIEPLGDDTINGVAAKKYRITSEGGAVLAWFDAVTSAPLRMESKADGQDAVIEWKDLRAEPQAAKLFELPKGYEVVDMDEMMAKMRSMQDAHAMPGMKGMAGVGGLAGPGAGSLGAGLGGMAQGVGQSFGSDMGSTIGGGLGAAFGGPIGGVAGQYLGGKVGGWLGAKAAKAVTPGN